MGGCGNERWGIAATWPHHSGVSRVDENSQFRCGAGPIVVFVAAARSWMQEDHGDGDEHVWQFTS